MTDAAGLESLLEVMGEAERGQLLPHQLTPENNRHEVEDVEVDDGAEHLPQEIPPHLRQLDSIVTYESDETVATPTRQLDPILAVTNQGKSKKGATKTALKWFDKFLFEYWQDDRYKEGAPPDLRVGRLYDHLTDDNLTPNLIGTFCTYLCDTESPTSRTRFLSWNSANNYLGQVISYHIDGNSKNHATRLSSAKIIEVFGDGRLLSKSRSQMQKKISERSKEHGIPLVIAKSAASELDWTLIAMSSVLLGSRVSHLSEFWAISVAMTHFASRGNETSYLQFMHGKCVDINEIGGGRNSTGLFEMNNFKQGGTFQEMHVFPHVSDWYRDFYFSSAYFFATSKECVTTYMFPTFAREALKSDCDGINDSAGVSGLWKRTMSYVCNFLDENPDLWKKLVESKHLPFAPGLTKDICSHSPRKFCVNEMGKTCTALYIIFRAGWKIENAHTIFDYLIRASHYDVRAAKACAGWTVQDGSQIWGGYNNKLSDLDSAYHKRFDDFSQYLFRHNNRLDPNLRHLYTFSVLRFYKQFVDFLGAAGYQGKHEFVERVEVSLMEANVDYNTFENWQKSIRENFKRRNFYGMMIRRDDADFQVDAIPLLDRVKAMESVLVTVSTENMALKAEVEALRSGQQTIIRLLNSSIDLLQKGHSPGRPAQVSSDEESQDGDNLARGKEYSGSYPAPWPDQERLPNNNVYNPEHYSRSITCKAIFKTWFQDQLPVRWENMLATVPKEKARKTRNQFSAFKKVVHVLLKNLRAYPLQSDDLDMVAQTAMSNLMIRHNLDKEPNRSQVAGGSKERVNGVRKKKESIYEYGEYDDREFPPGTPECIIAFFENKGNNPVAGSKRAIEDVE